MTTTLKAPFPYFGGKSTIASVVWERFGVVTNYVEPFFGSGAMLLNRPLPFDGVETVNDLDGMVANFWRAVQHDPDAVAFHADNPVNENDLHARHIWLVNRKPSLQARLEGDPEYFDAKVAGWWCWGICCWIGSGFCSGKGPWSVAEVDGTPQLVRLGDAGRGVNRKRVGLPGWMDALSERLRLVRVCCGDWSRVTGPTPVEIHGTAAVFLDPPYADTAKRDKDLYATDSLHVAHAVREWAIANGDNPKLRIALAGYEGEHNMPVSWSVVEWKAHGGYESQGEGPAVNAHKERLWFSPHCVNAEKRGMLFEKAK